MGLSLAHSHIGALFALELLESALYLLTTIHREKDSTRLGQGFLLLPDQGGNWICLSRE